MQDRTPGVGHRDAGVEVIIDVDDLHQALELQVADGRGVDPRLQAGCRHAHPLGCPFGDQLERV